MLFQVRAIKGPQGVTAFSLEATSGAAARSEIKARGYTVLNVAPARVSPIRGKRFPLLMFSQELIALLDAGLALVAPWRRVQRTVSKVHG